MIFGEQGGNATFTCTALGSPNNVFSWIRQSDNGVVVNGSELILLDIMASDGGEYLCFVENAGGVGIETVTLNGESNEKLIHGEFYHFSCSIDFHTTCVI